MSEDKDILSQDRQMGESGPESSPGSESGQSGTSEEGGLRTVAPFELVAMPKEKRRLLLWLARRKMASKEDIIDGVSPGDDDENMEEILVDLLSSGYIQEIEVEGSSLYRCQVRGQSKRKVSGMRDDIWSRIDDKESDRSEESS